MTSATLTWEWAPGYTPFDPAPVFVPLDGVMSFSYTEGRAKALEDFPSATAEITLDNSQREYDPDNSDGPHYGDLLPRVPIRMSAAVDYSISDGGSAASPPTDVSDGGDADPPVPDLSVGPGAFESSEQFTMFVEEGWQVDYSNVAAGTCTIRCVDRFGVLTGLPHVADTAYKVDVLGDDPELYLPFDEPPGTTVANDISGNLRHGFHQNVDLGGPTMTADSSTVASYIDDTAVTTVRSIPLNGTTKTIEYVARSSQVMIDVAGTPTALTSAPFLVLRSTGGTTVDAVIIGPIVLGVRWGALVYVSSALAVSASQNTVATDHREYHVVFQLGPNNQDAQLWINGVEEVLSQSGTPAAVAWSNMTELLVVPSSAYGHGGDAAHVAIYDGAVGATVAAHYATLLSPWDGDFTGDRARRILDAVDMPAALYDVDDGCTRLSIASLGDSDVGDYLRKVARTEQGDLHTLGHDGGKIAFYSRYARYYNDRSTVIQNTVGDDEGAIPFEGHPVIEPNGVASIINTATVNYEGGSIRIGHASDYGPHGATIDTMAPDAFWAHGLAEWVIAGRETPSTQLRSLKFLPSAAPGAWPIALFTRIADRLTFTYRPLNLGSRTTGDYWVEGRTISGHGVDVYEVELRMSPAFSVPWFTWDQSLWGIDTAWAY